MSARNTTALNFRLVLPKECSVKPKLAHLPSLQSDLRADYSHFKILGENPNENSPDTLQENTLQPNTLRPDILQWDISPSGPPSQTSV